MITRVKRGCVTPVLPTVYSDALSYGEQLNHLTLKMNEIIGLINGELDEALEKLIDEKFNNIMLDAMYDPITETLVLYLNKE